MRYRARQEPCQGWSLAELLIAGALLLVALLAVAPLFARALTDVREGGRRSEAALAAHSRLEARGGPAREFFSLEQARWLDSEPSLPDRAVWVRETTQAAFPVGALADGRLDASDAEAEASDEPRLLLIKTTVAVWRGRQASPSVVIERLRWAVQ